MRNSEKELPPVKQAFDAAKNKPAGYRETLLEVYGERLRLHVFAVVAAGFDRLVWEKLASVPS